MPIHKLSRPMRPEVLNLRSELEKEWRDPRTGKTAEPVIFETDFSENRPIELYVVWSRWRGVPQNERTELILDAYEAVRGKDQVLSVALAVGLTPEEAKEQGIGADETG